MADQHSPADTPTTDPASPAAPATVPDGELSEQDLNKVAGGSVSSVLSNLSQMQHDTNKAIISNLRA